jgi:RimJ/RimL family protein N-acetyltransferase
MNIKLKYKFLFELSNKQIKQLYKIVSNINVMKYVGKGTGWPEQKLLELIKFSKNDYKLNFQNTEYLFLGVLNNNSNIIGLCGYHPMIFKDIPGEQIIRILSKRYQGKGLGTLLCNQIIKIHKLYKPKNKLYSMINKSNISAIKSMRKQKFKLEYNRKYNNQDYLLFSLI